MSTTVLRCSTAHGLLRFGTRHAPQPMGYFTLAHAPSNKQHSAHSAAMLRSLWFTLIWRMHPQQAKRIMTTHARASAS
eukprot:scaffold6947_cov23-Tisochrysis_lutea.AAC.2